MQESGRIVTDRRAAVTGAAADWIAAAIAETVAERGRCSIAFSGGREPRPVYADLARRYADLPWDRVIACFGDERCVPPDHAASNYRMVNELLLRDVPVPAAQVLRMPGEEPYRDAAARAYERVLPDPLDILLLGMGEDGHTASLFPHAPQLQEQVRRVLPSESPVPPHARLTITPTVIASARRVAVLVTSGKKAAMLARALEGEYQPFAIPVQFALGGTWFVGEQAAGRLERVS